MGVNAPELLSMRYEARRSDADPAAKRNLPSGSRLKALGTASVGTIPTGVNSPLAGCTANPAMLLWPRLGTYRNFPEGEI